MRAVQAKSQVVPDSEDEEELSIDSLAHTNAEESKFTFVELWFCI